MYQHIKDDIIRTAKGELSKSSIALLNEITNATDAKIVISSTWRFDDDLFETLNKAGITGEIIGNTGRGCKCCLRGNEIRLWIQENINTMAFKDYVILDDDSDMLYWQRNNFVCVDGTVGITPKTVYQAVRILNGDT